MLIMRNHKTSESLLNILALMILGGLLVAATGVYWVEGEPEKINLPFQENHKFETTENRSTINGNPMPVYLQAENEGPTAPHPEKGFTVGELMRWAGIISILAALVILLFIEFLYKERISRLNYRTLMIVSMFALPVVVVLGTGSTVLETTKTVESCSSCHVMDPFVNDLSNPESSTLAARHFKNKWISEYQCYTCHTTYGAHGTFEGKRDGFRHWLLFVTRTWDEPISYSGSYPNINCTTCHADTQKFADVPSHQALSEKLRADEVSCTSCHGPAHPTPAERESVPEHSAGKLNQQDKNLDSEELAKLREMFHER